MTQDHPNIALMKMLDPRDLDASEQRFAETFVWHYINPNLPDLEGDYIGFEGLKRFFGALAGKTAGTFRVEPLSISAAGDELVVTHVRDTMKLAGVETVVDAVVVWRIVGGKFAEAWDIPTAYTFPD
ncbi:MAG: nuclear transport factor 2 family protein [Pseudomonadota bacterium]